MRRVRVSGSAGSRSKDVPSRGALLVNYVKYELQTKLEQTCHRIHDIRLREGSIGTAQGTAKENGNIALWQEEGSLVAGHRALTLASREWRRDTAAGSLQFTNSSPVTFNDTLFAWLPGFHIRSTLQMQIQPFPAYLLRSDRHSFDHRSFPVLVNYHPIIAHFP